MAAIATITAFDGASTPAQHDLLPVSVTRADNVIFAEWKESSLTMPEEASIRCTMSKTKLKNGIVRTSTRVEVPVMEAVNAQNAAGYTAAPKVAYVDTIDVVSYAHPRSTAASRRLARQLAINIANGVSTSVVPVTVAPAPVMIDLLLCPT